MSSKDLQGIKVLEEFIEAGIDSIKVEGRMKSPLYAGTIAKVYREALDYYQENAHFYSQNIQAWEQELSKVTHRAYHTGSLIEKAGDDSIFNEREHQETHYQIVGQIIDIFESGNSERQKEVVVEVRNAFWPQSHLEFIPFEGRAQVFTPKSIKNLFDKDIAKTRPSTLVKLPYHDGMSKGYLLRAKV